MNGGFKERAARNGTPTYVYDANGNLIQDKNKGVTITYNYLNLLQTITFDGTQGNAGGTIDFTYDATGKKWRKTVTPTRQCGQVRDYIDGVEYTSTLCGLILSSITPDIIHFSDGYIQRDPSTDGNYSWMGWVYKYALTDHLGNTRVVFSDKNDDGVVGVTDMEQINNYYPFGLNMDGPWNGASGQYKFQYNQKEWNSDLGLNLNDYGARFYDPTIGRWNAKDAFSERRNWLSPYNYVQNNPISRIDSDGNLDSLPNGRYIWSLNSNEMALFSDPSTRSQITSCGDCDVQLNVAERIYMLGKMLTWALPSGRFAKTAIIAEEAVTAANVVEEVTSKLGGRMIIVDENISPTVQIALEKEGFVTKTLPKGTPDSEIISLAKQKDALVMTNNIRDFKNQGITTIEISKQLQNASQTQNVVQKLINLANHPNFEKYIQTGNNVILEKY